MAKFEYKTCKFCLGQGCLRCNRTGQYRTRMFTRSDMEAARLRRKLFGDTGGQYKPETRQNQERRAL